MTNEFFLKMIITIFFYKYVANHPMWKPIQNLTITKGA